MDSSNKVKIRIRPRSGTDSVRIQVREKNVFHCSVCGNQYRDHHLFCPQCLGELKASTPQLFLLRVVSVSEARIEGLALLLQSLSGAKDFPFQKALESLPWVMICDTDAGVLHHWREVLEAEKANAEIRPPEKQPSRRWRHKSPLFSSNAPVPRFLNDTTSIGVRQVARAINDAALRFRWAELVTAAVRIVEDFYKRHPDYRILYSDFLFHIESELQDAIKDFHSHSRSREEEMARRIDKIQLRVDDMMREIAEVKKQVEERL